MATYLALRATRRLGGAGHGASAGIKPTSGRPGGRPGRNARPEGWKGSGSDADQRPRASATSSDGRSIRP